MRHRHPPSPRRVPRWQRLLALSVVSVFMALSGGCGSDDDAGAPSDTDPPTTTSTSTSTAEPAGEDEQVDVTVDADGLTETEAEAAARQLVAAVDRTRREGTWRVEITQRAEVGGRGVDVSAEVRHDAESGRTELRTGPGQLEVAGGDPLAGLWARLADDEVPTGGLDPSVALDVVAEQAPELVSVIGEGPPVDGDATTRYRLSTSLADLVGPRLSNTEAGAWLGEVADNAGLGESGAPSWVPERVREPWRDWVAPGAASAGERLVSIPVQIAADVDDEGLLRRVEITLGAGTVLGALLDAPVVAAAANLVEATSTVTFLDSI